MHRSARSIPGRTSLAPDVKPTWIDLRKISAFIRFGRTLRERAFKNTFSDPVFKDLDRSAGDHPAAAFAETIFDQRLLGIAHAAHHLHRFAADVEAGLITE